MKFREFKHEPVKPDTYEASMALNQLLKIGKHAIKIHNMIDDRAEMEAWVAKKIDLAGDYVKKVHGYMQGEKAGLYDDGGLTESREQIGDYAREIKTGRIVRIVDYTDDDEGIYTISYGDGKGETDVTAKSLKFLDQTGRDQEEIGKFDEDAGSLTDEQKKGLQMIHKKYDGYFGNNMDPLVLGYMKYRLSTGVGTDGIEEKELEAALKKYGYDTMYDAEQADDDFYDKINNKEHLPITTAMKSDLDKVMGSDFNDDGKLEMASEYLQNMDESVSEDAGEQGLANELSKYYQDAADGMDPEDHGNDEHDDYEDMAQGFKKGLQAGMDQVNMAGWEFSTNDFDMNRDGKGEVHYQMADILKKYNVSASLNKKGEAFLIKGGKAITDPGHWNKRMAEDAGEGHMSKSTLYHTAKYAIELMDMINKGDDLEGWVQSKLNKAADYLQGVYNYEEYQKLNPYREELNSDILQRHAGIVQKHIDEILAKETKLDDIDTKPGMMRILAKRVNEVEKEMAKENRKQTNEAPPGMGAIGKAATKVGSKILSKIPGMGQKAADLDSKAQADQQLKDVYKTFRDFAVKTGANANKPQASTVSAFLKQMNLPTTPELQGLQGDPMVSSKTLNTILTKATQGKVRGAPAPQQQARPTAGKGMSPDVKKIISGLTPQQKTQLAKML